MRALFLVLLLAVAAEAKDVDWSGGWSIDGGGGVNVRVQNGRYVVAAGIPAKDGSERTVTFEGTGSGKTLSLEGTLSETIGFVGALDGASSDAKPHRCTLVGEWRTEGDDEVARVTYAEDGSELRKEAWRRSQPLLEITAVEADGAQLTGAFDAKLSKTGLVVRYLLRGQEPRVLTARVVVDDSRHPYAGFYKTPRIFEEQLGTVEPGQRSFTWDGRDQTDAARIALQGGYTVFVVADEKHEAKTSFEVAPPHFEYLGEASTWNGDLFDPLNRGASCQQIMARKGYTSMAAPGPARSAISFCSDLENAAFAVIACHGNIGDLQVSTGVSSSRIQGLALKDLHVAIVEACDGAATHDFETGTASRSIAESLLSRGCDVVIAFDRSIFCDQLLMFESKVLSLLERGASIEKATRDALRTAYRLEHGLSQEVSDEQVDALALAERRSHDVHAGVAPASALVVKRAPDAENESDSFWPPRYGNSRN